MRQWLNWTPRISRVGGDTYVIDVGEQYFRQRYLVEAWEEFFGEVRRLRALLSNADCKELPQ